MDRNRWLVHAVAICIAWMCALVATGDIGSPTWNWSNWNAIGYNQIATIGQTFKGNGEACSGFRFRSYSENCCYTYPVRGMIYRWDASAQRAIGAPLAVADSAFSNIGCCWFDRELQFATRIPLEMGADFVLIITVTPWWNNYCCAYFHPAIFQSYEYSEGSMFYLSNGSSSQAWTSQQWNDTGYDLNFTIRTTNDCDGNGVPDATDIADGTAPDCNANGLSDTCEQLAPGTESLIGEERGPIGSTASVQYTFNAILPSQGDVQLRIDASADISATHEFLLVSVGAGPARAVFTGAETDCTWNTQTITIPRDEFNSAIVKNNVQVAVAGSPTVDAAACGGVSAVKVQLDYTEAYRDCNGNLVADYLDFCSGVSLDCNGNRNPDECDIASGASADVDADSVPDECQPDCNNDHRPDAFQIFVGEEPDCNANGKPDECDLYTGGGSVDCNSNGVPDECDIASGMSPDCDGDGKVDSCALAQGLVRDCNGNSVPDSCDIASGLAQDCNLNGWPDSCDVTVLGYVDYYTPQRNFTPDAPFQFAYEGARPSIGGDVYVEVYYYMYTDWAYGRPGRVYLDDVLVHEFYDCYWGCCTSNNRGFYVSASTWNSVASDGVVVTRVTAQSDCGSQFARLRFIYTRGALSKDCNSNGIPDECDISSGFDHDCNQNGRLDACDIALGAEDDNVNGYPDPCELDRGDLNLDGVVGGPDLTIMLSYWGGVNYPIGDCNRDGIIDGADLAILLGHWGEVYN